MVKERFRLLFEGERLFGVIDCQYEVFKKHGNTKKNNVKIGHHLNGVSGDREREKRWREYVGVGGKGKAGDRESGALGALGTEKESKKVMEMLGTGKENFIGRGRWGQRRKARRSRCLIPPNDQTRRFQQMTVRR
jgi:hypothetical protein